MIKQCWKYGPMSVRYVNNAFIDFKKGVCSEREIDDWEIKLQDRQMETDTSDHKIAIWQIMCMK